MSYPGANVHRSSRRKLGRNQQITGNGVTAVLSSTGTTNLTITFARPVVVTGTINTTVASLTLVSQTIVSPTIVTQVWSANVATHLATLPGGANNVATYQGGQAVGTSATF